MITDMWVLKLSGFGHVNYVSDLNPFIQNGDYDFRAYVAPELLDQYPTGRLETKEQMMKTDMYRYVLFR